MEGTARRRWDQDFRAGRGATLQFGQPLAEGSIPNAPITPDPLPPGPAGRTLQNSLLLLLPQQRPCRSFITATSDGASLFVARGVMT